MVVSVVSVLFVVVFVVKSEGLSRRRLRGTLGKFGKCYAVEFV